MDTVALSGFLVDMALACWICFSNRVTGYSINDYKVDQNVQGPCFCGHLTQVMLMHVSVLRYKISH